MLRESIHLDSESNEEVCFMAMDVEKNNAMRENEINQLELGFSIN